MGFIRQTWNWLWPEPVTFDELNQLQARLVRLLLYLLVLSVGLLTVRNLYIQTLSLRPLYFLTFVIVGSFAILRLRPDRSAWVARSLLVCVTFSIYWAGVNWATAVPPSVHYLVLLGLFGTLTDSPKTGNLLTLASLGVMVTLRQQFGFASPHAQMLWFSVTSCIFLAQIFSLAFYHVFVGFQEQLNDQAQRLQVADDERRHLVAALFQELQEPIRGLVKAATMPLNQAEVQLRTQVLAVADQMQAAASLRQEQGAVDAIFLAGENLRWVRRRFMVITLWVALTAVFAASINNGLTGGPLFLPLSIGVILGIVLIWLRGRVVNVDVINSTQLVVYTALFVSGVWQDGSNGVPETLPYLPNLVLAAAFLSGIRLSLLVAVVGLALIAGVWVGNPHSIMEVASLGNMIFALLLLMGLSREVWSLHGALLRQLNEKTLMLTETLRQRRRLLGTLFHDINNPLMAIQAILQLPKAGVALASGDHGRIQHMADRIRLLVASAQTFLLGDADVPLNQLKVVDVAQLFAETQELFDARLKSKRQHLTFLSPPGLSVLALPEVLRDSILSNLVSNALKFSPTAVGLELEARLDGSEVELIVRDSGPGVPVDVLDRLARGQTIGSQVGTGGEQGQGLGLGLVQEHLHRMGGRFELVRRVGGGTEARVWLKTP